jgi:uncharacterized membrane protein YgcG
MDLLSQAEVDLLINSVKILLQTTIKWKFPDYERGINFAAYSLLMTRLFKAAELDMLLNGNWERPDPADRPGGGGGGNARRLFDAKLVLFDARDSLLHTLIQTTFSSSNGGFVDSVSIAQDKGVTLWIHLTQLNEGTSAGKIDSLVKEFQNTAQHRNEQFEDLESRVRLKRDILVRSGKPITDRNANNVLREALLSIEVQNQLIVPANTLSYDLFAEQAKDLIEKMKDGDGTKSIFSVQNGKRKRGQQSTPNATPCSICLSMGKTVTNHTPRTCFKNPANKQNKKRDANNGEVICWTCNQVGHKSDACPTKGGKGGRGGKGGKGGRGGGRGGKGSGAGRGGNNGNTYQAYNVAGILQNIPIPPPPPYPPSAFMTLQPPNPPPPPPDWVWDPSANRWCGMIRFVSNTGVSYALAVTLTIKGRHLILDSACQQHIGCLRAKFTILSPPQISMAAANGSGMPVEGQGTAYGLPDAMFIPSSQHSLFSTIAARLQGNWVKVEFMSGDCIQMSNNNEIPPIVYQFVFNGEFWVHDSESPLPYEIQKPIDCQHPPVPPQGQAYPVSVAVARTNHNHASAIQRFLLLHLRYGHLSYHKLYSAIKLRFIRGFNFSIDVIKLHELPVCEHCLLANATLHAPSNKGRFIAIRPGIFWHTDTKYFKTRSSGRFFYMQMFIDDNSGVGFMYWYTHRHEALIQALIPFKNMLSLEYGMNQWTLRADKAGEYVSNAWDIFCKENGVFTQYIPTGQHNYNGVAEVRMKNIEQNVRPMLSQSRLPAFLHDEAAYTANDILNASPVEPSMESRMHRWCGKTSHADDYHVFGAKAILARNPPNTDISLHGD